MQLDTFIWSEYWPEVRKDLSPAWQRRTQDLLKLMAPLGGYEMDAITVRQAESWYGDVKRRFNTPVSPNKALTRAKHVFRTAMRWSICRTNPFDTLRRKKEPARKFSFLSPREQSALLMNCGSNLRDYQVFAKYTGARLSSLWKLEQRDINMEKSEIRLRRTKNGDDYIIPLHSELKRYIEERHLLSSERTHVLYQYKTPGTVSRMFRKLKRKQGIEFRFHDYRHSVGAALGSKFQNGRIVQDMLGHKDGRISLRYTHIKPEALRKAVEESI